MRLLLFIFISFIFISSCSTNLQDELSSRSFSFNYSVLIEPTDNKKLEMWIPLPSSNEVQTISNLKINSSNLSYTIEHEQQFGNRYISSFLSSVGSMSTE